MRSIAAALMLLASTSAAGVYDAPRPSGGPKTFEIHERGGARVRTSRPCPLGTYEYLVKNITAIEAIEVGRNAMLIRARGVSRPIVVGRVMGEHGFWDVSDRVSFYFHIDVRNQRATIGIIRRGDTSLCSEKWTGDARWIKTR